MTRLIVSLVLCLLFTAVQASNPVFGGYLSSSCDSCLDETYQSCPGDYKTRPYATCMCAGDGSANVVTCLSSCDPGLNEQANVSAAWFRYCILFFKDMCPAAEEYIDTETFDKQCSKEAIAAGGIGEKEDDDSGSGKDSDSDSKADASASIEPSKTTGSDSENTGDTSNRSETSEATQTTNSATSTAIPAWAVVAGLGLHLMII